MKSALVAVNLGLLLLLALSANRYVYSHLGHGATKYIDRLRSDALVREQSRSELSTYYEDLLFSGGDIKESLAKRYEGYTFPLAEWDPFDGDDSPYWDPIHDLRALGPRPSQVVMVDGVAHTFNRLGLRDQDYPATPDRDTYRIVMLGASNLLARGIPDGMGFEPVLERLLNDGRLRSWQTFEILNFGYDSYTEVKNLVQIDRDLVFPRQPRLIVFITHSIHDFWEWDFIDLVSREAYAEIGYPFLIELGKRLRSEDRRQLRDDERDEVVRWVYCELLERCESADVKCLAIGVPIPNSLSDPARLRARMRLIESTGMPVVSLDGSFETYDLVELQRSKWDDLHLNLTAHRIIARDIYAALLRLDDELGLGLSPRQLHASIASESEPQGGE